MGMDNTQTPPAAGANATYQIVVIQCGEESVVYETHKKRSAQIAYIKMVARGSLVRVRINGKLLLIWEAEKWCNRKQFMWAAYKYNNIQMEEFKK